FDPSAEEIRVAQEQQQQRAAGGGGGGFGRAGGGARGAEAGPGTYRILLTVGGRTYESTLTIRDDPDAKAMR
ncbi:MAG: hypothetical protein ABIF09_07670, partial [Gemmatimonadota bacterium]